MNALAVTLLVAAAAVTAGPAAAQDRVAQYLGLSRATLEQPITPAELEAALLSPAGVRDVAALFEKAIASSLALGGEAIVPELGGEATLDRGQLRFVEYPDPVQPVVRRMLELRGDPQALLDFLTGSVEGRQLLAATGGLHAHLFQMTTKPATVEQRRVLDQILAGAVAIHIKTRTATPEVQRAMIEKTDWHGRYVGFWHLHPPVRTSAGLVPGYEPSMEDMQIAIERKQLLTLVFRPDGFDAYDLEPLAKAGEPDLSMAHVIRYRSPEWARRFAAAPAARP
jgi:hypothetical protein